MKTETSVPTRSGIWFDLANPKVEDVRIRDIAFSLARIERWNGHGLVGPPVGIHCIRMADKAPLSLKLDALLHDAAEAYTGDLTRGFKKLPFIKDALEIYETRVQEVVAEAFGLQWPPPEEVLRLDEEAQQDELHLSVEMLPDSHKTRQMWDPVDTTRRFLVTFIACCRWKKDSGLGWDLPEFHNINYRSLSDDLWKP